MRSTIADYKVIDRFDGQDHRYACEAPARLEHDGQVLVTEMSVDRSGWTQLCDHMARLVASSESLLHPLELGTDSTTGLTYLATEGAPGLTLREPTAVFDVDTRIAAVVTAARTAHQMHEVGLAHGCICPRAILVTARGPVLDLPRLGGPEGEIIPTAAWEDLVAIDPQLLSGESPSRHTDIWSLGATLHALLSTRPIFPGIEADEPVIAVQRILLTSPELDVALPGPVLELIGRCLAANPADRPGSAMEVAQCLEAVGVND